MVRYVKLGVLEFARKEQGVPTVDDPVGGYLFRRFQKRPKAIIKISGMIKTYKQALEYFESGSMLRAEYEDLLRKAKPSSFSQRREELRASKILKSDIVREIFDDVNQLAEGERRQLVNACQNMTTFRKFAGPYLEKRVQTIPDDFVSYKKELIETFQTKSLEDLGFVFGQLRNVLIGNIDFDYGNIVKYGKTKETYYDRFCQATRGPVFGLADLYRELKEKFGSR